MDVMTNTDIVKLKNAVNDRDHATGPQSAPVTMVEYGNFECIHCGVVYPVIKKARTLLGDSLRFVFRHFPSVRTHPHSLRAAEAAESAGAQEKFWGMHDQLFTHQQSLEDHDLSRYASRIGLDSDRFAREMAEHAFLKQIQSDYDRSVFDEHVTGTPTLYINDVRYTGATDLESLLAAIKRADTQRLIQIPEDAGGLRALIERLRHGAKG